MLKVQYELIDLPGKGKGIIAKEKIPKGTVIWRVDYSKIR
jgi:hypothetical protein